MRRAGTTFDAALADAQRRGFAEADPTLDVDGWDAAQKLVILARLAMGVDVPVESVDRVGIRAVGGDNVRALADLGYRVRLLAHAEQTPAGVHLRVRPTAVGPGHLLGDVDDADNAVIISSDLAALVMLRGRGAGGESTASAVISDVVNAVRERATSPLPGPPPLRVPAMLGVEDVEVAGYVRLVLRAGDDSRALVLQALEDRGLAVDAAVELSGRGLIVLTGVAPRAVHDGAIETLDTLTAVDQIDCTLDRVEAPSR
jgi:homoserine dehydrogenase